MKYFKWINKGVVSQFTNRREIQDEEGNKLFVIEGGYIGEIGDNKQDEDNAKLIAAAPDLLKALKRCDDMLTNMDDDISYCNSNDYLNTVHFTKEAIKKATE